MKVGLFLSSQQQPGTDQVEALQEQIAALHSIRDHGWDSVWTGQHYLTDVVTMLQPVPYLARLAAEAGELSIGVGLHLLALANPVHAAEEMVTLDVISGGRLIYAAGLGYRDVEYDAFGVPAGGRVARFEANLDILKRLWVGERVSADLPWCRLDDVALAFGPVQQPRPPIWMGANSDGAVERAGRLADTWLINPHAAWDTIERQVALFRQARVRAGRPEARELPAFKEVICASTRDRARALAARHLGEKYATYARWGQDRVLPGDEDFTADFTELVRDRFVVGTPEDCIEQLLPWRDRLGVDHFIFRTRWSGMPAQRSQECIDLLAREVVPVLTGGS